MNIFAELCCFSTPKNLFFNRKFPNYLAPDFNRMVVDLKNLGWTLEKIAYVLPISGASSVREWICGSFMKYDNGAAFVELWMHLTNKTEKEIPRINRYLIA
ncbi:hypothetical protein ACUTA3_08200 [Acinetobacter baumannii]|uniref:hypothetical protein n=1 Tax=Acinetobacter TaxID=469 RepID=UPI0002BA4100|nr:MULTISPECIES: hypothetical protein [Acinetobacter]AYX95745.1 hypothetical protein EGY13_04975 [Acinetobacter sp. FDAARGOS_493]EHU1229649.1 hypothetical protein [Acinetobacter baumannii]EHU1232977.1 hypothetical protein [Acinetobacter baumannii]EHU1245349.1 hypothetical protein [Acinetobacter baumannii]EHU1249646.1 hypothetical protein [Acinetobacter baumannii]